MSREEISPHASFCAALSIAAGSEEISAAVQAERTRCLQIAVAEAELHDRCWKAATTQEGRDRCSARLWTALNIAEKIRSAR